MFVIFRLAMLIPTKPTMVLTSLQTEFTPIGFSLNQGPWLVMYFRISWVLLWSLNIRQKHGLSSCWCFAGEQVSSPCRFERSKPDNEKSLSEIKERRIGHDENSNPDETSILSPCWVLTLVYVILNNSYLQFANACRIQWNEDLPQCLTPTPHQ